MKIKIYQLIGYEYDMRDSGKAVVSEVFKTREEALEKMREYQKDAQIVINYWNSGSCRENICYKHGVLNQYSLILSFDIEDDNQRKTWLSFLTDGNIQNEQVQWTEDDFESSYKEYVLTSLSIKEIEL